MIPVLLIVIVLVLVVAYMGSRYKVAGANEALIVSGRRERGPRAPSGLKVVRGQGVIVLPLINKVGRLHLSARQINVQLSDAVTKQGIKVAVQGVATVKIGSDEESIRAAAERFLEREDQIDSIVKNVLEGSLRSIVGTLTVEELNYDRAKFQQEVQSAARSDLATSGLTIDNFTIQAIRDEVGYMDLIGQQETARRERDARMAKATADQEAAVREAEAQQIKLNAQRDVSLRQAEVEALTAGGRGQGRPVGPARPGRGDPGGRPQADRARPARGRPEAEGAHRVDDPPGRGRRGRPGQARRGREALADRGGPGRRRAGPARGPGRGRDPGHEGRGQRPRHRGQRRGDGQADHPRGQRRGGHRPVQGRGRGEGPRPARRGLPPVQRGRGHPDRAVDAAGDRPRGGRADGSRSTPSPSCRTTARPRWSRTRRGRSPRRAPR